MNLIQFGKLINRLTIWGMRELESSEMIELEAMVKPPVQDVQTRNTVKEADVDELLKAVKEGRKIDAIKAYRCLTNAGLKESKDAIERVYVVDTTS